MNKIVRTVNPEILVRNELQAIIKKKRIQLEKMTQKLDGLKQEIDAVRFEYDARIGCLYLKDNQLDMEILQFRQIQNLIEQGLSFAEAEKQVLEMDYYRNAREESRGTMHRATRATVPSITEEKNDIKTLWKTLISHYHPDRIADREEKLRREEIMKQVNKAYSEEDIAALQFFQSQLYTEKFIEPPVELLEKTIVDLENAIIGTKQDYLALRTSAWYTMKLQLEKAKKKQIDLFKDLERSLLNDIVKKIEVLKKLKNQVGVPEFA